MVGSGVRSRVQAWAGSRTGACVKGSMVNAGSPARCCAFMHVVRSLSTSLEALTSLAASIQLELELRTPIHEAMEHYVVLKRALHGLHDIFSNMSRVRCVCRLLASVS